MIVKELLKEGNKILRNNHIKTSMLDAEIILSMVINKTRENVLLSEDIKLSKRQINQFNHLIRRRAKKKEPIAYIVNHKNFWNYEILVDKNTLIPRPETELMVEKLICHFKNKKPFILDVGTGSGCIILSLLDEMPDSKGVAIDISCKALQIAKKNCKRLNLLSQVKFMKKSIKSNFNYKFDLIVSNPPYIERHKLKNLDPGIRNFEPKIALDGGNDGLDVIRKVIYKSRKILKLNGLLALEIGNGQHKKVSKILSDNNFKEKFLIKDYKDNVRCIISTLVI